MIDPDEIEYKTSNQIEVDLSSFISITGTWNIRVNSGGSSISNINDLGDVDFESGTPADDYIMRYDSASGKWKAEELIINTDKIEEGDSSVEVVDVSGDISIKFKLDNVEQIRLEDGVLYPITNNDIDLGKSDKKFKNGYFAGKLTVDGLIDPTGLVLNSQAVNPMGSGQEGIWIDSNDSKLYHFDGTTDKEILNEDHTDTYNHTNIHEVNKDTYLAFGTVDQASAGDVKDAVDKKHTQNGDTKLDDGEANETTASELRTALDTTIPGKANKVSGGVEDNFMSIDNLGHPKDSGYNDSSYADAVHDHDSDYLAKDNTTPFTPDADYEPATKKYVDDALVGGGFGDMFKNIYDTDDDGIVDYAEALSDGGTGNEVNYTDVQDAVDKKHEHSNKELLDTYDQTNADISDAISKKHTRQHAIDSTSDHTSSITQNNLIDADANGLPDDSGLAVTDVSDAISKKHSQNTDTGTNQDTFEIGDGTEGAHKLIEANIGQSGTQPGIRYNKDTDTWQISNDGSTWEDIEAGTGSGDMLKCYDKKTEILTIQGFKKIENITKEDIICTLNPDNNIIEYQYVVNIYKYNNVKILYSIKSQQIDLAVTPNHKMYVKTRRSNKFELLNAKEIFGKRVQYKKDGIWKGIEKKYNIENTEINIELWAEFLGYYLSEGFTIDCVNGNNNKDYKIGISQVKSLSKEKMFKCVREVALALNHKAFENGNEIFISSKKLYNNLKKFGKSYEKFIPLEIKNSSSRIIKIFLNAYILGDGHKSWSHNRKTPNLSIFTTSLQMVDDLQELCLKNGMSANSSIVIKKGTESIIKGRKIISLRDCYRIGINQCKCTPMINHGHQQQVKSYKESYINYNDTVYGIEVSKYHTLYVRRNGKTVWSGNSTYDIDEDGIVDKAESIDDGVYSATAEDIADAISKEHEHSNKALLDTYTQTEVDIADAISKEHTRQHAIDSTSDHTSSITQNNLIDADANGLPDDSGLAVTDVSDAISKKHSQNTDTGTSSDDFAVGDGTDTDKIITADNGDANEPKLKYDSALNKWRFANDGITWLDIGSGGSLTVKAVDNDPTIASVSEIQIDDSSGLVLTDEGGGVAKISLGSHWKDLEIDGQSTLTPSGEETLEFEAGSGIAITTNSGSTPKKITISASGSATSYRTSFDNGDLSSGILTVTHSLNQKYVGVSVYNNNDIQVIPDIELKTVNSLEVDLSGFGTLVGTWNIVVLS